MTTPILKAQEDINRLRNMIDDMKKRHGQELQALADRLNEAVERRSLASENLDVDRVRRAEKTIYVKGNPGRSVERLKVVDDAVRDLASDDPKLMRSYFGTKNYASWSDQRENHNYGYGPKHGTIVFSIGLVEGARHELTPEDRDDAIWYLLNLRRIQSAKEAATV